MDKDYYPELDDSPFLNAEMHTRYQFMVGSLNWAVTIGRFDIQYAVTTQLRNPVIGYDNLYQVIVLYLTVLVPRSLLRNSNDIAALYDDDNDARF